MTKHKVHVRASDAPIVLVVMETKDFSILSVTLQLVTLKKRIDVGGKTLDR